MNGAEWEQRLAEAWASLDERGEAEFQGLIESLVAELPPDSAIGAFERTWSFDSTGHPDRAVPAVPQGTGDRADRRAPAPHGHSDGQLVA